METWKWEHGFREKKIMVWFEYQVTRCMGEFSSTYRAKLINFVDLECSVLRQNSV